MIDRGHALSVSKQAKAAGLARSTVYYLPRPVSPADLKLMRQLDELHLEFPFAGARMLRRLLATSGALMEPICPMGAGLEAPPLLPSRS